YCEAGDGQQRGTTRRPAAPQRQQQCQSQHQPAGAGAGQQHHHQQRAAGQQQAAQAKATLRRDQQQRRQRGEYQSELEIAGAEHPGQALRIAGTAKTEAAERLDEAIDAEQRQQRGSADRRFPACVAVTQRFNGEQQEEQEAQVGGDFGPGAWRVDGIGGGQQLRQPVAEEQQGAESRQRLAEVDAPAQQRRDAGNGADQNRQLRQPAE